MQIWFVFQTKVMEIVPISVRFQIMLHTDMWGLRTICVLENCVKIAEKAD